MEVKVEFGYKGYLSQVWYRTIGYGADRKSFDSLFVAGFLVCGLWVRGFVIYGLWVMGYGLWCGVVVLWCCSNVVVVSLKGGVS